MAKLTLKAIQKSIGAGTFVKKQIKYRGSSGEEFSGEVFIKVLTHDELAVTADVWGLKDNSELTIDQYRKALLFHTIYEDEETRLFSKVEEIGLVSTEVIGALFDAADEAVNFTGKLWISNQEKNSGVSLSSMELAEAQ
ncbi:hypothetical protein I6M90_00885 [Acinetobacter bereziniae]|uniref:hypothetical protein n=1 Tax=Acinetobacter bereziniae TaxID=106648 RepID=UPI0019006938|nr:hypothetical protein [Acinetobacter bereziniae]MBJ8450337.1 hypothetical protein [Acinetobacter bereziniae]MBJ8454628.1 hypothetical protein [Acinetobacter bereziniae]